MRLFQNRIPCPIRSSDDSFLGGAALCVLAFLPPLNSGRGATLLVAGVGSAFHSLFIEQRNLFAIAGLHPLGLLEAP